MQALGLNPAPSGSRVLAYAAIAAGVDVEAGFEVAGEKTMVGTSIITLGLQPDLESDSIVCPGAKRRIVLAQLAETVRKIEDSGSVDRKVIERLVGRLCNLSQLYPEVGAELHGGYANAKRLKSRIPKGAATLILTGL
jgi:hypothetical protein